MEESKNDDVFAINKEELWEQMKNSSESNVYSLKFEAIDINPKECTSACYIDEKKPSVGSNFQHASLFRAMLDYIIRYIDDIETIEEFDERDVVIEILLEKIEKLTNSINKQMSKYLGEHLKNYLTGKETDEEEEDEDE